MIVTLQRLFGWLSCRNFFGRLSTSTNVVDCLAEVFWKDIYDLTGFGRFFSSLFKALVGGVEDLIYVLVEEVQVLFV